MSEIQALIARFGLPIIFVGAAVEGDITLLLAGVAAHLGMVDFLPALTVGWAGALLADTACYSLGRSQQAWVRTTRAYQRIGASVERLAARFGAFELILARLVYGTRLVSMLLWGTLRLPLWRFLAADAVGCALWATGLAAIGYAGSQSAGKLLGEVKDVEVWLLAALVIAVLGVLSARLLVRRWYSSR